MKYVVLVTVLICACAHGASRHDQLTGSLQPNSTHKRTMGGRVDRGFVPIAGMEAAASVGYRGNSVPGEQYKVVWVAMGREDDHLCFAFPEMMIFDKSRYTVESWTHAIAKSFESLMVRVETLESFDGAKAWPAHTVSDVASATTTETKAWRKCRDKAYQTDCTDYIKTMVKICTNVPPVDEKSKYLVVTVFPNGRDSTVDRTYLLFHDHIKNTPSVLVWTIDPSGGEAPVAEVASENPDGEESTTSASTPEQCTTHLVEAGYEKPASAEKICATYTTEQIESAESIVRSGVRKRFSQLIKYTAKYTTVQLECARDAWLAGQATGNHPFLVTPTCTR